MPSGIQFGELSRAISRQRQSIFNIGFLNRGMTISNSDNEFQVMRRWNSFTPLTSQTINSIGGGYLLLWGGKVTVIDPGYGFMNLFAQKYSMLDVHCVIVTHDHPDHCEDLSKILTLLRELNEQREEAGLTPHRLRLLLSYGAYFKSRILLENEELAPYLDCTKVLPPLMMDLTSDLGFKFSATVCQHKELLGDSTTFGVRLELYSTRRRCILGITSDTGYRQDIARQYESVDALMLHIGSMEDVGSTGLLSSHLGTRGVKRMLRSLAHPPKLAIITEWGEEFFGNRVSVCDFIKSSLPNQILLPGDLLMRIRLPDCRVSLWQDRGYLDARFIEAFDEGANIRYERI